MIRSLPATDRRWLLEQLERLEQGDELSSPDLAELAVQGGAFDDLADEPDLYSSSDGEAVTAG